MKNYSTTQPNKANNTKKVIENLQKFQNEREMQNDYKISNKTKKNLFFNNDSHKNQRLVCDSHMHMSMHKTSRLSIRSRIGEGVEIKQNIINSPFLKEKDESEILIPTSNLKKTNYFQKTTIENVDMNSKFLYTNQSLQSAKSVKSVKFMNKTTKSSLYNNTIPSKSHFSNKKFISNDFPFETKQSKITIGDGGRVDLSNKSISKSTPVDFVKKSVLLIQSKFKTYKSRAIFKFLRLFTIKLQSLYRGYLYRKRYRNIREYHIDTNISITIISKKAAASYKNQYINLFVYLISQVVMKKIKHDYSLIIGYIKKKTNSKSISFISKVKSCASEYESHIKTNTYKSTLKPKQLEFKRQSSITLASTYMKIGNNQNIINNLYTPYGNPYTINDKINLIRRLSNDNEDSSLSDILKLNRKLKINSLLTSIFIRNDYSVLFNKVIQYFKWKNIVKLDKKPSLKKRLEVFKEKSSHKNKKNTYDNGSSSNYYTYKSKSQTINQYDYTNHKHDNNKKTDLIEEKENEEIFQNEEKLYKKNIFNSNKIFKLKSFTLNKENSNSIENNNNNITSIPAYEKRTNKSKANCLFNMFRNYELTYLINFMKIVFLEKTIKIAVLKMIFTKENPDFQCKSGKTKSITFDIDDLYLSYILLIQQQWRLNLQHKYIMKYVYRIKCLNKINNRLKTYDKDYKTIVMSKWKNQVKSLFLLENIKKIQFFVKKCRFQKANCFCRNLFFAFLKKTVMYQLKLMFIYLKLLGLQRCLIRIGVKEFYLRIGC